MKTIRPKLAINSLLVAFCLALFAVAGARTFAQNIESSTKPITLKGLEDAIKIGGLQESEFIGIIQSRGVDFVLTPQITDTLRGLGASAAVIQAVGANYRGTAETVNTSSNAKPAQMQPDETSAASELNLGLAYAKSEGVRQDFAEAARWYERAANQGLAEAQHNLGLLYYQGQGVPQDYVAAASWFRKAAEQGYAPAQDSLGDCYEEGRCIQQDYAQAAIWYRKAAEQGYAPAQNSLGYWCYEHGRGIQQDYAQAAIWFRKAAEQGYDHAQNNLDLCYQYGRGIQQDYAQAAIWYRKAAEQGNAWGQFYLGSLYSVGKGATQDYAEAYFWFNLAAARSNEKDRAQFMKARDAAAEKLSPTALTDEQKRASDWSLSHKPQQR